MFSVLLYEYHFLNWTLLLNFSLSYAVKTSCSSVYFCFCTVLANTAGAYAIFLIMLNLLYADESSSNIYICFVYLTTCIHNICFLVWHLNLFFLHLLYADKSCSYICICFVYRTTKHFWSTCSYKRNQGNLDWFIS